MSYAELAPVRVDTRVDAPPSRVWELVTDIELPVRFSPELRRVEWSAGTSGPALAATFYGYNRNPHLGQWRTRSHIVELAAERAFAWVVVDPDGAFGGPPADPGHPVATWRFDLEPEGRATRLRQSVRLGPARSGISLAIELSPQRAAAIVEGRLAGLRSAMQANLDGIKALAEQPG